MLPLRISGTTSRLACPRQLRRCAAQLGHTVGIAKPDGGMSTWKRPLAFKAWKTGKGTRASYDAAKHTARHAVHHAHQEER